MTAYRVTIVDYRTSNLLSIVKALQRVGAEVELTQSAEQIEKAEKLVLPGVGAFGAAMRNIESLGIRQALINYGKSAKPLIGICLGMQLLFNVSFEQGIYDGLGLVSGEVVAFPQVSSDDLPLRDPSDGSVVKVPHMGWNQVEFQRQSKLLDGLQNGQYAYFVHSYYVRTNDNCVTGVTDYGVKFPAIIEQGNIFGIQFHPEKSQTFGLKILENFLRV